MLNRALLHPQLKSKTFFSDIMNIFIFIIFEEKLSVGDIRDMRGRGELLLMLEILQDNNNVGNS